MTNHKQVEQDIENALRLAQNKTPIFRGFTRYSEAFLFGTENQEGVNGIINYSQKTVLTPASSGDHYISAVYYDACKVDTFDINRITYYITYLKIAAIITLDYEEFLSFFVSQDEAGNFRIEFWNLRTLKRLLPSMPRDAAYFWDKIMYAIYLGELTNPLYSGFVPSNIQRGMPFYKSKEEYYKLQSKLKDRGYPKFYEADILSISELLDTKYDIIYLSNIIECLVCQELYKLYHPSYYYENIFEKEKTEQILEVLLPFLKKDGIILLNYRPNNASADDWLATSDLINVSPIPCKYPPTEAYNRQDDVDMVFTYKPNKKRHK